MKENGGCVQRICGSVGDNFYAVCTSSNGNIAVGGADRTVTIYDPRRWLLLNLFTNTTCICFFSSKPSWFLYWIILRPEHGFICLKLLSCMEICSRNSDSWDVHFWYKSFIHKQCTRSQHYNAKWYNCIDCTWLSVIR